MNIDRSSSQRFAAGSLTASGTRDIRLRSSSTEIEHRPFPCLGPTLVQANKPGPSNASSAEPSGFSTITIRWSGLLRRASHLLCVALIWTRVPASSPGVMALRGGGQEIQVVTVHGKYLAQAVYEMPIGREVSLREPLLKLVDDLVQAFHEVRDVIGETQPSRSQTSSCRHPRATDRWAFRRAGGWSAPELPGFHWGWRSPGRSGWRRTRRCPSPRSGSCPGRRRDGLSGGSGPRSPRRGT
ncbi:hypothetical protein BH24ACT19_BH24ACT19_10960 [soil metagenome]